MNNYREHQKLVDELLFEISGTGLARVWIQVNGLFRAYHDPERLIKSGVNGMADISGILINGRRLELEVKTGKGKRSEAQENWKKMIEKFGGVYIEARTVGDTIQQIRKIVGKSELGI